MLLLTIRHLLLLYVRVVLVEGELLNGLLLNSDHLELLIEGLDVEVDLHTVLGG
jgi:hypothetical protein